ncbi:hypothetical protein MNB_SV-12-275 [hydrothermal vent metagenome]|uniref:Uncharacterized protein n=1 Tax=hydrothermal vent metagenome TaxID=652676 RepID=A0A1W1CA47_9ZZZZ
MNNIKYTITAMIILNSTLFSADTGFVKQVTGSVKIKRLNKTISVKKYDKVYKNDIVITKANSAVSIILDNGEVISLEEKRILHLNRQLSQKKNFKKHLSMCL